MRDRKTRSRNEINEHLSEMFRLTEDELNILTKGGHGKRFYEFIGWTIKDFIDTSIIKKVSNGYQLTIFGKRLIDCLLKKPID